jgi:hypothetical protein
MRKKIMKRIVDNNDNNESSKRVLSDEGRVLQVSSLPASTAQALITTDLNNWPTELYVMLFERMEVPAALNLFQTSNFFRMFSHWSKLWRHWLQRDMPEEFAFCGGELPAFVDDWRIYYLHLRRMYFQVGYLMTHSKRVATYHPLHKKRDYVSFREAYLHIQTYLKRKIYFRRNTEHPYLKHTPRIYYALQFADKAVRDNANLINEQWFQKYLRLRQLRNLHNFLPNRTTIFQDYSEIEMRDNFFSNDDERFYVASGGSPQVWHLAKYLHENTSIFSFLSHEIVINDDDYPFFSYFIPVNAFHLTHVNMFSGFIFPCAFYLPTARVMKQSPIREWENELQRWSFMLVERGTAFDTDFSVRNLWEACVKMFSTEPRIDDIQNPDRHGRISLMEHCIACGGTKKIVEVQYPHNVFCDKNCQKQFYYSF